MKWLHSVFERRSFITRAGAAGAVAFAGASVLHAQSSPNAAWQPARETKDDWLDKIPGKHRMIFDNTMPDGFGAALMFANNFYIANKSGYGLQDADLAVVVVARHYSMAFALNHAMWAKYGTTISRLSKFTDPATKQAPTSNTYMSSLEPLLKRGVHLAVCEMATQELSGSIGDDFGKDTDSIYRELTANLVMNSHMVAAGIVAVNRAQERGYAFVGA
jgi:intracellular sulfur oxidation DsrE/DsrF family protein